MLSSRGGLTLALLLVVAGCSNRVALRPAKSCEGGNLDRCREGCQQNQAEACYRLGWFHEEGQGVAKSPGKAIELYGQACDAKMAVACRALGIIYWNGDLTDRQPKKAIDYFQRACALGLPEACPTPEMLAAAEGRKRPAAGGSFGAEVNVGTPSEPPAPSEPEGERR